MNTNVNLFLLKLFEVLESWGRIKSLQISLLVGPTKTSELFSFIIAENVMQVNEEMFFGS
jgi:hypothetical protein